MGMPKTGGCPDHCDSSTSETRRELEPTHNCFWDRHWGGGDQLLASVFPVPSNSPRNLLQKFTRPRFSLVSKIT